MPESLEEIRKRAVAKAFEDVEPQRNLSNDNPLGRPLIKAVDPGDALRKLNLSWSDAPTIRKLLEHGEIKLSDPDLDAALKAFVAADTNLDEHVDTSGDYGGRPKDMPNVRAKAVGSGMTAGAENKWTDDAAKDTAKKFRQGTSAGQKPTE